MLLYWITFSFGVMASLNASVTLYQSLSIGRNCTMAAGALLYYDYFITFDREAALFWKGRLTGATLLFLIPRYTILVTVVLAIIATSIPLSDESCNLFVKALPAIAVSQYIPWAVFSGLRAFALSKHKFLSLLVFTLSLVPLGFNLALYGYGLSGKIFPHIGCAEVFSIDPVVETRIVIASRTCITTADALVVLITWWKLVRERNGLGRSNSLMSVVLYDGTLYFLALFALNSFCIALSLIPTFASNGYHNFTVFAEPITAILVARFLLDLQAANRRTLKLSSNDPLQFPDNMSSGGVLSFIGPALGSIAAGSVDSDVHSEGSDLSDSTCYIDSYRRQEWDERGGSRAMDEEHATACSSLDNHAVGTHSSSIATI